MIPGMYKKRRVLGTCLGVVLAPPSFRASA
jgi:hypothetical protein